MEAINDKDISEWLSEYRAKHTRTAYIYGSRVFFSWLRKERNTTLDQFKALAPKEMKTLIMSFQNSEPKGKGWVYAHKTIDHDEPLSHNAIALIVTPVSTFCAFLEKPLMMKGKRFRTQNDVRSHCFANGDLGRMFDVSNLKGKATLATASSLGWEVSDFLALDRKVVEAQIKLAEEHDKCFVFFEQTRTKTGVARLAVLNPLAIKSLKEWLAINKTDTLFDMKGSGMSKFLEATATKANLTLTGGVRFHRIRAWTYNSLLKAGFSSEEAKYVIGKVVPRARCIPKVICFALGN
jgi:hypothetical protein